MKNLCIACGSLPQYESCLCRECLADKMNEAFEEEFRRFKEEKINGSNDQEFHTRGT